WAEGMRVLSDRRHASRASDDRHLPLGFHLPLLAGLAPTGPPPPHALVSLDWWYPTLGENGDRRPSCMDTTARHARLVDERQAAEAASRAAVAKSPRRLRRFNRLL